MNKIIIILVMLFTLSVGDNIFAETDSYNDIGIVEKLGSYVPLNLTFTNVDGKKVILKDLVNKPTLLAFVYYKCPGICTPILTELANVVGKVDLVPGEDYNIVTISIDQNEKPADALEKKNDIIGFTGRYIEPGSWSFLTGDSVNIKLVTEAAGYLFRRVGNNFIHSGGFMFITKEGKICRYLYPDYTSKGQFSILPFDFKMAYVETAQGQQVKTMSKLIKFCFNYDPKGRTYVFNITRIFGVLILVFMTLFMVFVVVKPKKTKIAGR
jgi:protein SCO1/2